MAKTFSELTIKGHFILVKGFLMGFWSCQDSPPGYFFYQHPGIHQETFMDIVSEFFELDDRVKLCLEDGAIPAFQQAVEKARTVVGLSIESVRKIRSAEFEFSVDVVSRDLGEACKTIFSNPPEGVELVGFDPKEEVHEEGKHDPHLHAYRYRGKGIARGDFDGVHTLYLNCKKSEATGFISLKDMELKFEA